MSTSAYRQIAVTAGVEAEEAVTALLATLFETTPSTMQKEGAVESVTSVYVGEDDRTIPALKREILQHFAHLETLGIAIGPVTIRVRKLAARDWRESWKRHFRAQEISPRLLVRPPWSRKRARKNQATVVLDPGMSFGTGHHPTTRFCLEQLAANYETQAARSLLDIGTGSGILAIAAAKLGFEPIVAFDNDPDAVRWAEANARRNRVSRRLELSVRDLNSLPKRTKTKYSVVCANLTHDLLKQHNDRITAQLQPGGLLCLAGILNEQFAAVSDHFAQTGWAPVATATENEWTSGAFRKED